MRSFHHRESLLKEIQLWPENGFRVRVEDVSSQGPDSFTIHLILIRREDDEHDDFSRGWGHSSIPVPKGIPSLLARSLDIRVEIVILVDPQPGPTTDPLHPVNDDDEMLEDLDRQMGIDDPTTRESPASLGPTASVSSSIPAAFREDYNVLRDDSNPMTAESRQVISRLSELLEAALLKSVFGKSVKLGPSVTHKAGIDFLSFKQLSPASIDHDHRAVLFAVPVSSQAADGNRHSRQEIRTSQQYLIHYRE